MTSQPVRAAAADLASRLLISAHDGAEEPVVVAVIGSAGSGRSGVLDAACAVAERSGRSWRRIEDLHLRDDDELRSLQRAADPDILLLSWIERHPSHEGLGAFARRAARRNLLIQLDVLSDDELANGAAAVLGAPPDRALTEWLTHQTARQPWLVHAVLTALVGAGVLARGRFSGAEPALDHVSLAPVLERIQADLRALPAGCRPVVAAMVADSDPLTLAEIAVAGADGWLALNCAGLVTADAAAPIVVAAAAGLLSPAERAAGHQSVARLLARRGVSALVRAEHVWAGRAQSDDAAHGFLEAGFELLGSDPRRAVDWFDRAAATAAAGSTLALAARGAQAEGLIIAGDAAGAMELADFVLGRHEDEPHAAAAVAFASTTRGRWGDVAHWSARVRGHHGVTDPWWFWQQQAALLVAGRVAEVDAHLGTVDHDVPVTPMVSPMRAAVLVLRAALRSERHQLLEARRQVRSLIAAQDLARPPVVAAIGPAELLAAVALALGEPEGARQAFVATGFDGRDQRRRALARWTVLRCGDMVRPLSSDPGSGNAESPGGSNGTEDTRDPVPLAVAAATARRSGDVAATGIVARQLPRLLAVLQIDLLNVDAATELLIVARRFASAAVAEEFDDAIETLLAAIGHPPAFSARWHWAKLESAIAAGQSDTVSSPARALEAIAAVLPGITVLADAAATWLDVLAGNPDPARLETTVGDLRTAGYVWEAAQLAGQAAIRVDDASLAKSLLGQARSLRGASATGAGPPVPAASSAGVSTQDGATLTPAGLSEREVEVARLVVNGLTHKAIGATLYISPKTVEHHVAHIRQKLGATNRAEFLASLREDLAASSAL